MKNQTVKFLFKFIFVVGVFCIPAFAQTAPPDPSAPKSVKIPAVKEFTLKNGMKVVVVERIGVPLITVQLMVKSYANVEEPEVAGLGTLTADLLTKGTKSRSANEIAQQMEFLGATIDAASGRNSTNLTINVMSDKVDQALAIMADVAINPSFKEEEIELLKAQMLDGLTYNLTQPGFLANYVATPYSFGKTPIGGTVESIKTISREDIQEFHKQRFIADSSVLIFSGNVSAVQAKLLAQKHFGKMGNDNGMTELFESPASPGILSGTGQKAAIELKRSEQSLVKRVLVVDLPNSGQAAVSFAKNLESEGRIIWRNIKGPNQLNVNYYSAIVLNSLLGGGYSSRLNQEIRIKRGLSYGAGSNFSWQWDDSDFVTRTQTKNESAAEVAELVVVELRKLSEGEISESELNPRRMVLTGGLGRSLETNQGLANALGDLYSFELPTEHLDSYSKNVMSVTNREIKEFAARYITGGDIIIVGDYAIFKDDLAKRFPNMTIDVIKADDLDISKENLRK